MGKASRSRRRKGRDKRHAGATTAAERPSSPAPSTESPKPAAQASHEDDFFARGEETSSFPPSSVDAPDAEIDETAQLRQRPEVIERRARLRRVVTWIVGTAAVLTVLVTVKALLARSHPRVAVADTALSVPHQVVASIAMTEESVPAPAEPVALNDTAPAAPAEVPGVAETASAEPAPAELARAAEAPQPAEPSAAPAPSKADVRHLIERGNMKGGIAAARTAIEADPSDAETYLLLGAALQELGQWKESMAVFTRCVDQATMGPKNECRALRGR